MDCSLREFSGIQLNAQKFAHYISLVLQLECTAQVYVSKEDPLLSSLILSYFPKCTEFFSIINFKKMRTSFKFKAKQVLV